MIKFINLKDSKGSPIYGQPLLDTIFHVNLPANTVVQLPIENAPDAVMISSTGNVIVSPFSTVVLPTLTTFEQTSGMLNLSIVQVSNLNNQNPFIEPDNLYFIAPDQCLVYVGFFSIT